MGKNGEKAGLTFRGCRGEKQGGREDNPGGCFSPRNHGEAAGGERRGLPEERDGKTTSLLQLRERSVPPRLEPGWEGVGGGGGEKGGDASNFGDPANFPSSFASSDAKFTSKR